MTEVTRFRHHYYYCRGCHGIVHGTGKGEMSGSYIGLNTKSTAALMRYEMHIPYRKVKDFLDTVFKMKVSNGGYRKRILKRVEEFIICLDYAEVCAHNNPAERALRGNVIIRKVTFGNVSEEGEKNHEVIMSLKETAKMKDKNILEYFYGLLTNQSAMTEIL